MTWLIGTIVTVVDDNIFDVNVEQYGGPYATDIGPMERVLYVNHEVNSISRPDQYANNPLIGKRMHCEIHSRSPNGYLVVTATPR